MGDTLECPHQLPVSRLLELIERARRLRFVDSRILDRTVEVVGEAADALDSGPPTTLVHGDLHFENVLWDGDHVSAVLDLEWARPGPADLDLDILLRFCADPGLHVAADYERLARRDDYRQVPIWLRAAYPEVFSAPRLVDRLVVYSLAYDVRQLLQSPPTVPAADLPPHHPWNRIRRVVGHRTHIHWMLAEA
jgi:hypothetical protein